jgi:hypothetical protein
MNVIKRRKANKKNTARHPNTHNEANTTNIKKKTKHQHTNNKKVKNITCNGSDRFSRQIGQ